MPSFILPSEPSRGPEVPSISKRLSIGKPEGPASCILEPCTSKRPRVCTPDLDFELECAGLKMTHTSTNILIDHPKLPGPNGISNCSNSSITTNHTKRTREPLPDALNPKRAKEPFKLLPACRGLCPKQGRTIDAYCEFCHGYAVSSLSASSLSLWLLHRNKCACKKGYYRTFQGIIRPFKAL